MTNTPAPDSLPPSLEEKTGEGRTMPLGQVLRMKRSRLRLSLDQMVRELEKDGYKTDKAKLSRIENSKMPVPHGFLGVYLETLRRVATEDAEAVGLLIPEATNGDE